MDPHDLTEFLSLLQNRCQKNLLLVAAYFLQEVQKRDHFSSKEIQFELLGQVTGASKINVGAVFLNQCVGLIQPLKEKSSEGSKLWKLTNTGSQTVAKLLGFTKKIKKAQKNISFSLDNLHSVVRSASAKLFRDGHMSNAVEAAFKAVNRHLRQKTGRTTDGGVAMMHKVFSPAEFKWQNDCLRLNLLGNQSDRDEQDGYRFLFAGAQQGIRNPFDHDGRQVGSPLVALEYLAFASHLARMIDKAQQT